jgi:hypothetical protein
VDMANLTLTMKLPIHYKYLGKKKQEKETIFEKNKKYRTEYVVSNRLWI